MIKSVSALVFGASLLAAAPASAADYLIVSFDAKGTADLGITPNGNQGGFYDDLATQDWLTFYLPVVNGSPVTSYNNNLSNSRSASFVFDGGTLTVTGYNRSADTYGGVPYQEQRANLTITGNVTLNPGFYADISSSSVTYNERDGGRTYGYSSSFTGTVSRVSVREGFGTPAAFGLISGPVGSIPEPATWALMMVGFAATAYALRRRPKVAFA